MQNNLFDKQTMPVLGRVYIRVFGCQQNVSDSERIAGLMAQAGYQRTQDEALADVIILLTCAVRRHAEDRVLGNIGALKKLKQDKPSVVLALGGCMIHQRQVADNILKSYPFVDILFNSNELQKLPEHIRRFLDERHRIDASVCEEYRIEEQLPVQRDEMFRAFVPIMYGCDNFCTYCVVPHVRGRERSRAKQDVKDEMETALTAGYKDIMLLGQNVNSYGRTLDQPLSFSALLSELCEIDREFILRFMTSHPKDATQELFDTIACNKKISRHIHLPVQSGSDRILKAMNRNYTAADYLRLIEYARKQIPNVTFSSDILVGFPGETEQDVMDTLAVIREVRYTSLFTFIYSPRQGTAAALLPDDTPHREKAQRLRTVTQIQDPITEEYLHSLTGQKMRVLISKKQDGKLTGRLDDNHEIELEGVGEINTFCRCLITGREKKRLIGVLER